MNTAWHPVQLVPFTSPASPVPTRVARVAEDSGDRSNCTPLPATNTPCTNTEQSSQQQRHDQTEGNAKPVEICPDPETHTLYKSTQVTVLMATVQDSV